MKNKDAESLIDQLVVLARSWFAGTPGLGPAPAPSAWSALRGGGEPAEHQGAPIAYSVSPAETEG